MDSISRLLGNLETGQRLMRKDVAAIRKDVEELKRFRWKLAGGLSLLVVACEAIVSLMK